MGCQGFFDGVDIMIGCQQCAGYVHLKCAELTEEPIEFFCAPCLKKGEATRRTPVKRITEVVAIRPKSANETHQANNGQEDRFKQLEAMMAQQMSQMQKMKLELDSEKHHRAMERADYEKKIKELTANLKQQADCTAAASKPVGKPQVPETKRASLEIGEKPKISTKQVRSALDDFEKNRQKPDKVVE